MRRVHTPEDNDTTPYGLDEEDGGGLNRRADKTNHTPSRPVRHDTDQAGDDTDGVGTGERRRSTPIRLDGEQSSIDHSHPLQRDNLTHLTTTTTTTTTRTGSEEEQVVGHEAGPRRHRGSPTVLGYTTVPFRHTSRPHSSEGRRRVSRNRSFTRSVTDSPSPAVVATAHTAKDEHGAMPTRHLQPQQQHDEEEEEQQRQHENQCTDVYRCSLIDGADASPTFSQAPAHRPPPRDSSTEALPSSTLARDESVLLHVPQRARHSRRTRRSHGAAYTTGHASEAEAERNGGGGGAAHNEQPERKKDALPPRTAAAAAASAAAQHAVSSDLRSPAARAVHAQDASEAERSRHAPRRYSRRRTPKYSDDEHGKARRLRHSSHSVPKSLHALHRHRHRRAVGAADDASYSTGTAAAALRRTRRGHRVYGCSSSSAYAGNSSSASYDYPKHFHHHGRSCHSVCHACCHARCAHRRYAAHRCGSRRCCCCCGHSSALPPSHGCREMVQLLPAEDGATNDIVKQTTASDHEPKQRAAANRTQQQQQAAVSDSTAVAAQESAPAPFTATASPSLSLPRLSSATAVEPASAVLSSPLPAVVPNAAATTTTAGSMHAASAFEQAMSAALYHTHTAPSTSLSHLFPLLAAPAASSPVMAMPQPQHQALPSPAVTPPPPPPAAAAAAAAVAVMPSPTAPPAVSSSTIVMSPMTPSESEQTPVAKKTQASTEVRTTAPQHKHHTFLSALFHRKGKTSKTKANASDDNAVESPTTSQQEVNRAGNSSSSSTNVPLGGNSNDNMNHSDSNGVGNRVNTPTTTPTDATPARPAVATPHHTSSPPPPSDYHQQHHRDDNDRTKSAQGGQGAHSIPVLLPNASASSSSSAAAAGPTLPQVITSTMTSSSSPDAPRMRNNTCGNNITHNNVNVNSALTTMISMSPPLSMSSTHLADATPLDMTTLYEQKLHAKALPRVLPLLQSTEEKQQRKHSSNGWRWKLFGGRHTNGKEKNASSTPETTSSQSLLVNPVVLHNDGNKQACASERSRPIAGAHKPASNRRTRNRVAHSSSSSSSTHSSSSGSYTSSATRQKKQQLRKHAGRTNRRRDHSAHASSTSSRLASSSSLSTSSFYSSPPVSHRGHHNHHRLAAPHAHGLPRRTSHQASESSSDHPSSHGSRNRKGEPTMKKGVLLAAATLSMKQLSPTKRTSHTAIS